MALHFAVVDSREQHARQAKRSLKKVRYLRPNEAGGFVPKGRRRNAASCWMGSMLF